MASHDHTSGPPATASIDIPRLLQHPDSMPNFVGSPEPLQHNTDVQSTPRSLSINFSAQESSSYTLPRPRVPRSISSPHTPIYGSPTKGRPSSLWKLPEISSSILNANRPEREWTVFGQLLENENSLLTPGSIRSRRTIHSSSITPALVDTSAMHTPAELDPGINSTADPRISTQLEDAFTPTASRHDVHTNDRYPEYDSEQSDSEDEVVSRPLPEARSRCNCLPKIPTMPTLYRNILKCSIAYFIASLFTFSPYLSSFIADITSYGRGTHRPSPSGHMVATVAVYYNPAKTLGGMLDADIFCSMGLFFASFVSLSCMSMYWFFEVQPGWEWLADTLVIIWIGLSMSGVAWMKVWMAKPAFNTACSMTAIILFVVIIKEGGLKTLLQVACIIILGASISNLICYLLWPQRATANLQANMTKTLDSFSTLLTLMTQTFLLEESIRQPSQEKIQQAVKSHQASFVSLKNNLAEAQSERFFGGPGKVPHTGEARTRNSSGQAYEDAIDSLNRLGQHLNGLRSGVSLQFDLIKAHRDGKVELNNRNGERRTTSSQKLDTVHEGNGKDTISDSILEAATSEDVAMFRAAADMFGDLVDDLGPPLKALSSTCTTSFKRLRAAFVQPRQANNKNVILPHEFQELADDIERALFTFESTSNHAVMRLYRTNYTSSSTSQASFSSLAEYNTLLTGTDSENIFLVYFFIFTLQEFAKELVSLVDAMGRICNIERAYAARPSWWKRLLESLKWPSWRRTLPREKRRRDGIRNRLSAYFIPQPAHRSVSFPKVRPHAPNTIQTPARSELSFTGKVKQSIWFLGARLQEQDLKYAFKAGMATAVLAAPAFFDTTRPTFVQYRGEWALISFFVVISPTIGATNFLGVHRVLGTLFGALTAAVIWTLFPEDPIVLPIFGFLFSIPCFYYIVGKPEYATTSRFVLLTYNLTCLYSYNLRQKDISVWEIAYHRAVAVAVGVVWAAIVSRYWWPTEARRELSKALGDFCLNVGWLYTRLVAFNSMGDDTHKQHIPDNDSTPTEETSLLSRHSYLDHSIEEFMAMELHLQIKLIELQKLLAQTQHEPRLKGPFPVVLYRNILTSLQTILDKLHSMRCVTSREEWHTTVRDDFIIPVNRERREMVGNIILYFSTLASAFRLKSPLPPYLPPAEQSRQRLVNAIRQLDVVKNRDVKGSRQLLFFAYALTMKSVIHELDYLGRILQDAFGVIGQSTAEFNAMFDTAGNGPNAV